MTRKSRNLINKLDIQKSWKNKVRELKIDLKSKGLGRTPYTNFDENTKGGILDIGLLKERPRIESGYEDTLVNEENKEVYIESNIPNYTYFFIRKENPSIRGDKDKQYSFYIIEAIIPISIADCSKQLGISEDVIKGIGTNELESGFFNHPVYINDTYKKLKIYYGELPYLIQIIPGRMDDLPFGYPAFNYNKSNVVTNTFLPPSAPFTFFYAEGHTPNDIQVIVNNDGTLKFLDKSPQFPIQIKPTSWTWKIDGIIKGNTQNLIYDFSLFPPGTYDVSLTASNQHGSQTYIREDYVLTTGKMYLDQIYPASVSLGFSLKRLSGNTDEVVRVRRWIGGTIPADEDIFSAEDIVDGTLTSWIGAGNSGTCTRLYQQFTNGIMGADLYAPNSPGPNAFLYEPLIVDNGNLVLDSNGEPSLYFNGDNRMECRIDPFVPNNISSPFTTYSVFTLPNATQDTTMISEFSGDRLLWVSGGTGNFGINNYTSWIINNPNERQIIHSVYSPTDSITGTTGDSDINVPDYNKTLNRFYIGHNNGNQRLAGHFSEFLVFNGDMNNIGSTIPGESDMYVINNKINMRYI